MATDPWNLPYRDSTQHPTQDYGHQTKGQLTENHEGESSKIGRQPS